jgi:uncharacterized membrane-anchored protein
MKGSKRWWIFACLLPVLGYGGLILFAEGRLHGAPRIEVPIEGVDPRDLLRGRYMIFRVKTQHADLERSEACVLSEGDGRHVLYLEEPTLLPRPPRSVTSSDCEYWIDPDFVRKMHRVYVQADQASDLEKALLDGRASVRLALVGGNSARVVELLIDGKSL